MLRQMMDGAPRRMSCLSAHVFSQIDNPFRSAPQDRQIKHHGFAAGPLLQPSDELEDSGAPISPALCA